LGLTGQFPDASSDEDEYVTESDHSDKESSPPPRTKPVANIQQLVKPAEPQKPRVIDRPVQLSSSIVPTSQPKSNGLQVRGKLKLEPHPLWYHIERPEPSAVSTTPNAEIISHHHARGKHLLQVECDAYMSSNHITSSDRQFLSTIMTSGTQTDKLSALTLSISASPLHCQKQLDALLGMAKKKSRNEAVQAVAALKDLLIGNLLPDRKLIYFGKQPGLSSSPKDEELILWTFEDWLKGWYFQVLQVIEVLPELISIDF
jgi:ribosome biogenesis protein MAK21